MGCAASHGMDPIETVNVDTTEPATSVAVKPLTMEEEIVCVLVDVFTFFEDGNLKMSSLTMAIRYGLSDLAHVLLDKGISPHTRPATLPRTFPSSETKCMYCFECEQWSSQKQCHWAKGSLYHCGICNEALAWKIDVEFELDGTTFFYSYDRLRYMFKTVARAKFHPLDNPLYWAARNDNPEILQRLLDSGLNIETRNWQGQTPLVVAIEHKNVAATRVLVANGANKRSRDLYHQTPLDLAGAPGNEDMLSELVRPQVHRLKNTQGRNPRNDIAWMLADPALTSMLFRNAACADNVRLLRFLVEEGSDINAQDAEGQTALHIAVKHHQHKAIRWLVRASADQTIVDAKDMTARQHAIRNADGASLAEFLPPAYTEKE